MSDTDKLGCPFRTFTFKLPSDLGWELNDLASDDLDEFSSFEEFFISAIQREVDRRIQGLYLAQEVSKGVNHAKDGAHELLAEHRGRRAAEAEAEIGAALSRLPWRAV